TRRGLADDRVLASGGLLDRQSRQPRRARARRGAPAAALIDRQIVEVDVERRERVLEILGRCGGRAAVAKQAWIGPGERCGRRRVTLRRGRIAVRFVELLTSGLTGELQAGFRNVLGERVAVLRARAAIARTALRDRSLAMRGRIVRLQLLDVVAWSRHRCLCIELSCGLVIELSAGHVIELACGRV